MTEPQDFTLTRGEAMLIMKWLQLDAAQVSRFTIMPNGWAIDYRKPGATDTATVRGRFE